jgi:hypothetical protein
MRLKPAADWFLKGIAALLAFAILIFLLLAWLRHPKFSTDNIFIRPAGPGVFKMSDIPRGRALTPQEIDQYADKLLAEMSSPKRFTRCPATRVGGNWRSSLSWTA